MYQREYEQKLRAKCELCAMIVLGLPALLTYPIAKGIVYLWHALGDFLENKIEDYVKRKSEEAFRSHD